MNIKDIKIASWIFAYVLVSLIFFLALVTLGSVFSYIDATPLSSLRGPVSEEALKFLALAFCLRRVSIPKGSFLVGFGFGSAETAINTALVYKQMLAAFVAEAPNESIAFFQGVIAAAIVLRLLLASILHGLTVYLGMRLAPGRLLVAFCLSVALHWTFNQLIAAL